MKIYDYNGKKNVCGDRIHEARCKLRLTQSDLAAKLQVAGIIIEREGLIEKYFLAFSGLLDEAGMSFINKTVNAYVGGDKNA